MTISGQPRPKGRSIQPYRQKSGYSDKAMLAELPRWKAAGIARVYRHGFVGEQTVQAYEAWAAPIRAAGLDTGAAFGLAMAAKVHPQTAGESMGRVFASKLCSIGVTDAEGAFDTDDQADASAAATQMGAAVRQFAPTAYLIDQPWPIIGSHAGFPIVEFAAWNDEHDAQEYATDFKVCFGKDRWPRLLAWSSKQWAACERDRLGPANVIRPRGITVEGYGHDDVIYDLVDVFYNFEDANIWTEWLPEESCLMAGQAADFLREYSKTRTSAIATEMAKTKQIDQYRAMTISRAIVGVFQRENGLGVDYLCGFDTMAKMGIKRAGIIVSMFRSLVRAAA